MLSRFVRSAACAAFVLCAGAAFADPKASPPDMDAMMKEWAKWSTPGASHKVLEKMAGKWTTSQKMWMDPTQPPMESKGTAELTLVLGGRFLQEHYTGELMGMPFEGMGLVGYDNFRKEYISSWADNMGTYMMHARGTGNAAGTEVSMSGIFDEPASGEKDKKFREVIKITGPDSFVFEMYDTIPGKGEVRVMELTHTRVK